VRATLAKLPAPARFDLSGLNGDRCGQDRMAHACRRSEGEEQSRLRVEADSPRRASKKLVPGWQKLCLARKSMPRHVHGFNKPSDAARLAFQHRGAGHTDKGTVEINEAGICRSAQAACSSSPMAIRRRCDASAGQMERWD